MIFATWRPSGEVARDARLVDDLAVPMAERLAAAGRTSPAELEAHDRALVLLARARLTRRGPLTIGADVKAISALSVPLAVVLAAILEAGGVVSASGVLARFGLAPRDVGWIVEASLIDACLAELVRRRLVDRVDAGFRARSSVTAARAA